LLLRFFSQSSRLLLFCPIFILGFTALSDYYCIHFLSIFTFQSMFPNLLFNPSFLLPRF
jgi:hypothetical protein